VNDHKDGLVELRYVQEAIWSWRWRACW